MKQILALLACIIMSMSVHAAVDVTYSFDQQNVQVLAFDCLDANCGSTMPFSGSIIKGPNVNDGSVILRYPDSLATEFGYAEFFVASGFRPLVGKHNWNTQGLPGIAATTQSASFTKMPNTCRATVSQLSLINTVEPHKPLTIDTAARLDAATASAFKILETGVDVVPQDLLQEFWGADTVVKLEVLNGATVINAQEKSFTAANNNAIIADTAVPVTFTFVPEAEGSFVAKVTATVVDNQCASQEDQFAQSSFAVATPQSQFYSILNSLSVNKTQPNVGELFRISVNKITNHVANDGTTLTPTQTVLELSVQQGNNAPVVQTQTVSANPDATNPVFVSFDFTPTVEGIHLITVRARAQSLLSTTLPEIAAEQSLIINIIDESTTSSNNTSNNTGNTNSTNSTNNNTNSSGTSPPIQIIAINPASGSVLTTSPIIVSVTTNVETTCKWSFEDILQDQMENSFATTNGIDHTASISFANGANNIFVSCGNQVTSEKVSIVYSVQPNNSGENTGGSGSSSDSSFGGGSSSGRGSSRDRDRGVASEIIPPVPAKYSLTETKVTGEEKKVVVEKKTAIKKTSHIVREDTARSLFKLFVAGIIIVGGILGYFVVRVLSREVL